MSSAELHRKLEPVFPLAFPTLALLRSTRTAGLAEKMDDLFIDQSTLKRLPMEDADVLYAESFPLSETPEKLLQYLVNGLLWRNESISLWGRKYPQPRLIAWYGDPGASYTYSGITLKPLPWNNSLKSVKRSVEDFSGFKFNSVLANYYRNSKDSMGFHSDDEPELGTHPVIASVSLGDERTLVLRHKKRKELSPVKIRLASGSILLMKGTTQECWLHGVLKESLPCGPRVNLTFRRIRRSR